MNSIYESLKFRSLTHLYSSQCMLLFIVFLLVNFISLNNTIFKSLFLIPSASAVSPAALLTSARMSCQIHEDEFCLIFFLSLYPKCLKQQ